MRRKIMPFTMTTVHYCPVAKGTQGIIEITPKVIRKLAKAVKDRDEWLVVGLGTKKENGLYVIVDDLYVPPNQYRDKSHCRITDDDPIPSRHLPRAVCGIHSHNSMRATFSGGDKDTDGICSVFSSSIVIGNNISKDDDEGHLLGFEYEAEVTFELPCGALGVCSAKILPSGINWWPLEWTIKRPSIIGSHKSLGDCSEYTHSADSNEYLYKREAKCGLSETEENLKFAVFGDNDNSILKALPKPGPKELPKSHGVAVPGDKDYYSNYYSSVKYDIYDDDYDQERWMEYLYSGSEKD
jgi:hypothetical protein